MNIYLKIFLRFFFIIAVSSQSIYSQNIVGKMISRTEASVIFGDVTKSLEIPTSTLQNILALSTDKVMFKIIDSNIIILDNNRNCLLPGDLTFSQEEVFKVFSISVVAILLNKGRDASTLIELRNEILTISNGDYTIEYSYPCPPFCE